MTVEEAERYASSKTRKAKMGGDGEDEDHGGDDPLSYDSSE